MCLTQVPDFILRVTLKSWAGADLHELRFLKVLGSSLLLHILSLSISITLVCCMFSFPFPFSDSSYAKSSIPSHSPHYLLSFAHSFPVSPHALSTAGLLSRYLCHPRQFLSFLQLFWMFEILSLFPICCHPFHSFPCHYLFPLPILFFNMSPTFHPSMGCRLVSHFMPFHLPGSVSHGGPPLTPHCLHPPLSALSCAFFGSSRAGSPSSRAR